MPDFTDVLSLDDDGNWVFDNGDLRAIIEPDDMARINSYEPRSPDEIQKLAQEALHGDVFTSSQCPSDLAASIFMVLAFADEATRVSWVLLDVSMVYEYVSKAGNMAINGYPIFSSCNLMNGDEHAMFSQFVDDLREDTDG